MLNDLIYGVNVDVPERLKEQVEEIVPTEKVIHETPEVDDGST